jgi:hypothetical protein
MLVLTESEGGRMDLLLDGEVDAASMERVLDEFIERMASAKDARLLFDIADFHMPSLDAIRVKFSRMRKLFAMLRNIGRIAILTDEAWLRQASKVESMLLPGIEMQAFARADRARAEAWLAEGVATAGR